MQRSPEDEARRWLEQAREDLKSAQILVENRRYDVACFLFQQSAEKALKAFLYAQGEDRVLGHSIAQLLKACVSYDQAFTHFGEEVNGLDLFYISARYPNGLPDDIPANVYNASEARRAQSMAVKVVKTVKEKLKPRKK